MRLLELRDFDILTSALVEEAAGGRATVDVLVWCGPRFVEVPDPFRVKPVLLHEHAKRSEVRS